MHKTVPGALLLAALFLGACTIHQDQIIDTWPVGAAVDCQRLPTCDELVAVGLEGLAAREPGLGSIVATQLHVEGTFVDASTGDRVLMTRSGDCCRVLVVELADGTRHAIGVGYPGISDKAVAIDWETLPG